MFLNAKRRYLKQNPVSHGKFKKYPFSMGRDADSDPYFNDHHLFVAYLVFALSVSGSHYRGSLTGKKVTFFSTEDVF